MQAPTSPLPLHESVQWNTGPLDLDAYLQRIGYRGSLIPSVETLRALQQAHLSSIPFENLDIITGGEIRLNLAHLQNKLVHHRRGGYCHEQNLLFGTLLNQLGFQVVTRGARMLMGEEASTATAIAHTMLVVSAEGRDWLVDVGVGNIGPREPVPLEEGIEVRHGHWEYRMERSPLGLWLLRHRRHDGWFNVYQFGDELYVRADAENHNFHVSHHPESPFVRGIIVQHNGEAVRYSLSNLELKTLSPGQPPTSQQVTIKALPQVLRELFGLELAPEQEHALQQQAAELVATQGEDE
uniref:arylamine N-acetyltransferase family protein n=1 Tax=Halomonas sp. TaxID=1486246 RepID=UPI00262DBC74|nr:arylamine N-acetyltransferase [Halomonas sp.]